MPSGRHPRGLARDARSGAIGQPPGALQRSDLLLEEREKETVGPDTAISRDDDACPAQGDASHAAWRSANFCPPNERVSQIATITSTKVPAMPNASGETKNAAGTSQASSSSPTRCESGKKP